MGFCYFYEELFWYYLCCGTILAPKIFMRNNDNPIANEGTIENLVETYVI